MHMVCTHMHKGMWLHKYNGKGIVFWHSIFFKSHKLIWENPGIAEPKIRKFNNYPCINSQNGEGTTVYI